VCLHSASTARPSEVREHVVALLERTFRGSHYTPGERAWGWRAEASGPAYTTAPRSLTPLPSPRARRSQAL
jgi:hypothetical protein